jgi:hypothetical protein
MNQYEAPRRTLEPVIDFGSVSDFEKSLLQKGKEGMQATLAYVFGAASAAVEKTFEAAGTVTGTTFDTLSTVAPAPVASAPAKSIEGGAR